MNPGRIQRGMSMKKNNNNNIKKIENRPSRKSYFDKEEDRNGPSWMSSKMQTDMYRDAKFIIKDLVRGNIDIAKHAHYFNENIIINVVKMEADRQMVKHRYIVESMDYHISNMRLQNIQPQYDYMSVYTEECALLALYQNLSMCFANILTNQDAYAQLSILIDKIKNNSMKNNIEDITY